MRTSVLVVVLAAIALASCVPPVEETTTPAHFNPETVMGQIQQRGFLKIGIASDRPLFDDLTKELGSYVAAAFHVEPSYVEAPNDELLPMIDDGSIDMAFPITTITESLVRHYSFTDPYWVAHQRVLSTDRTFALDDLSGRPICAFVDPETEVDISTLQPDLDVHDATSPTECVATVRRGGAATASDAVLMGIVKALHLPASDTPVIGGDDLTTEGYGAVVVGDAPGFIEVVNNILARAQDDGTWAAAVKRSVLPYGELDAVPEPPDLTVEEAAALYPAGT